MFLIVIDEILVGAIDRKPNRGLLWHPITMEHLNDFELAAISLLAQRRSDMQSKLDDFASRSSAAGLTINVTKIKWLDVNTVNPSSFTVDGQSVLKASNILVAKWRHEDRHRCMDQEGEGCFCEFKKCMEKQPDQLTHQNPNFQLEREICAAIRQ